MSVRRSSKACGADRSLLVGSFRVSKRANRVQQQCAPAAAREHSFQMEGPRGCSAPMHGRICRMVSHARSTQHVHCDGHVPFAVAAARSADCRTRPCMHVQCAQPGGPCVWPGAACGARPGSWRCAPSELLEVWQYSRVPMSMVMPSCMHGWEPHANAPACLRASGYGKSAVRHRHSVGDAQECVQACIRSRTGRSAEVHGTGNAEGQEGRGVVVVSVHAVWRSAGMWQVMCHVRAEGKPHARRSIRSARASDHTSAVKDVTACRVMLPRPDVGLEVKRARKDCAWARGTCISSASIVRGRG